MHDRFVNSWAWLVLMTFLLGYGCSQKEPQKIDSKVFEDSTSLVPLRLDTFSNSPEAFSACTCFVATDTANFHQSSYILISDFSATAFVKLNGEVLKFDKIEEIDYKKDVKIYTFKSGDYKLVIESKEGVGLGSKIWKHSGHLTLMDGDGHSLIIPIVGDCGC